MKHAKTVRSVAIRFLAVGLLVALDQLTKYWITAYIPRGGRRVVIPGFFEISHVRNTGAAWGVFSGRTLWLSVLTAIACLVLLYLLTAVRKPLMTVSLTMVLSGALGNLIDRIRMGEVVDFLRFYIGRNYEFPNFNVADICITCGCAVMVIAIVRSGREGMDTLFRPDTRVAGLLREKPKRHTEENHEGDGRGTGDGNGAGDGNGSD